MKKVITWCAIFCLFCLALVPSLSPRVQAEDKNIKIGVAFYKYDDAYMSSVRVALEKIAKEHSNVELIVNDSQNFVPHILPVCLLYLCIQNLHQ